MTMISLVIRAEYIVDGTEVRKPSGEKKYIVRRSINIFNENGKERTIEAYSGTIFLMPTDSDDGSISAFRSDRLLAIDFDDLHEAQEFIESLARKIK